MVKITDSESVTTAEEAEEGEQLGEEEVVGDEEDVERFKESRDDFGDDDDDGGDGGGGDADFSKSISQNIEEEKVEPTKLTDVEGEDGFRLTQDQLSERVATGDTEDLSPAGAGGGSIEPETKRETATREQEKQIDTALEKAALPESARREGDVALTDVRTSEGRNLTAEQLQQRVREGRVKGLRRAPTNPDIGTVQPETVRRRETGRQDFTGAANQTQIDAAFSGTPIGPPSELTQQEIDEAQRIRSPLQQDIRPQGGEILTGQEKIITSRKNLSRAEQTIQNAPADAKVTLDGEEITKSEALQEIDKKQEQLDTAEEELDRLFESRRAVLQPGDQPGQVQLTVDGETGIATREGERFAEKQQELQFQPLLPELEDEPLREIAAGRSPVTPSVAGQLREDVQRQFITAGKGALTIDETRQRLLQPTPQGEIIDTIGEQVGIFEELPQSTREEQKEAFQETVPTLSIAQQRIDEQVTDEQFQQLGEQTFQSVPQTEIVQTTGEILRPEETREFQEMTGRGFAQEVPEKAIESASLANLAVATGADPVKTGEETARGAVEVGGEAAEAPVQFGVQEIFADVGLDALTGGGAAITVPNVQAVPQKAGAAGQRIRTTAEEIQRLRQGGREGPSLSEAFVQEAAARRQEQQVLATDTVDPDTDIGPGTDGPETFDPVTPEEADTLDIIDTDTTTTTTVDTSIEAGLTQAGGFAGPETVTTDIPGVEGVPEIDAQAQVQAQPQTQVQAVPQAQAQAEAQAQTQVQVQPQIQPQIQPQVRSQIRTTSIDFFDEETAGETGRRVTEESGRGFEFAPSIDAIISGKTVTEERARETGLLDEEFTGTETRPVVIEENGDDELQDLFNF